jgi:IPT/TIG domain-containing protein
MLSRLWLLALVPLTFLAGCNNTLNPLCGSARPKPLIASLSPSTVNFSDVQNGVLLSVNGSQFVPASEIVIAGKTLAASATSDKQLQVMLTPSVISGPGTVNVKVVTPSGGSSDVGCSSGGTSSVLTLTVK